MKQAVVAVLGLSGVGKSTVLREVASEVAFQHLQASAVVKAAQDARGAVDVGIDELRHGNIADNQALLIEGFSAARDPAAAMVVLDGHSIIDTPQGLVRISPGVFTQLGVEMFIFLADGAEAIAARRTQDQSRRRPARSAEELANHQQEALENAFRAAQALGVPMIVCSPLHIDVIKSSLVLASRRRAGRWAYG